MAPPPLYLVTEEQHDGEGTPIRVNKKGPFRRAVRRILRKKRTDEENTMHMLTKESANTEQQQQQVLTQDFIQNLGLDASRLNTDFILQNFQDTTPNDVFPSDSTKHRRNVLTSDNDVVDASLSVASTVPLRTTKKQEQVKPKKKRALKEKSASRISTKCEGGSLAHRMTRSWFQNLLTGIIQRRSKVPPVGLSVRVAPSKVVKRIFQGQFRCDASIDFARVVFQNIRLTGGSLQAKHMTMSSFGPRYVNQFHIHANNCTLTEDDLFESSCIRNGLARLLVRILKNAGVTTSKIQITSVNIVVSTMWIQKRLVFKQCHFFLTQYFLLFFTLPQQPSGKISVSGLADTGFGSELSFEVRTFIGKASRGHIVTFPGLEVSLGPSLGVFVPVVPEIDLDIGHNAMLRDISVDGRRRRVSVSASATVTPNHTMKLAHKYRQHSESYAAQFSFDVGRFVTSLGNFTS